KNEARGYMAGNTRGVPIFALIPRLALHNLQAFLCQRRTPVKHDRINSARSKHPLPDFFQARFIGLSEIKRYADDLYAKVRQPACNRATVQAAASGKCDGFTFEIARVHDTPGGG